MLLLLVTEVAVGVITETNHCINFPITITLGELPNMDHNRQRQFYKTEEVEKSLTNSNMSMVS